MSRIEEIISNALAGIDETEVAILARELLKTREALALAQQQKGFAEGRAALAERQSFAMIIPPLNDDLVERAISPNAPRVLPLQPSEAAAKMWLLIGEYQRDSVAMVIGSAPVPANPVVTESACEIQPTEPWPRKNEDAPRANQGGAAT